MNRCEKKGEMPTMICRGDGTVPNGRHRRTRARIPHDSSSQNGLTARPS